ncbi:hypothetical protein [uncultured Victivallis sp.]|uniref:hypothetical protein n=1 Tax=uncultured Victivallis sp. TaxID=354118 RepID=UPI002587E226|nr:hypothetical protein [uncultured Victivallis sp.]
MRRRIEKNAPCACCKAVPRVPGRSYCARCERKKNNFHNAVKRAKRREIERIRKPEAAARFEQLVEWWRSVGGESIARRVSK